MSFQKNILVTYSAQIVSVLTSFLCSIMAARMLHASGQGELALYMNFMLFGNLLFSVGLPPAFVHFIASKQIDKQLIFPIIFRIVVSTISLMVLLLIIFHSTNLIQIVLPSSISSNLIWLAVLIFHLAVLILNSFLSSILQAEQKFKEVGLIGITGSILLLILYFFQFNANEQLASSVFKWIIISMMSSQLIQLIFYLVQIYRHYPIYFRFIWKFTNRITPLINFAILAFTTNLIQFLSYRMDIWFVHYFHNTERTGIYALSASLAQMVWMLPAAIQSVLYSFISTHQDKQLNIEKTIRTTKQIGLYAISAGIIGYLLSIWLVPILFGIEFKDSVQCIGILLLGIVPFCLSMSVSAYFAATGRVRMNLYSAIIGFAICLVGDLILIPSHGIIGASFASVFSYIATVSYLLLKFRTELKSI